MKICILFICLLITTLCYSQNDTPAEIRREKAFEDFGDYAQFAPAVGSIVTILVYKDKKGGWQFVKSFAVNLATTYALKYTINKPRPEGALDGHAFPSGHTSVAFQGASFLQRRYGWSYGIPAYAVAGLVAYSRLEGLNDRHDGWDVFGGIIVGVGSTYLFTTPYQKEHFELTFNSGKGNYLVGFKYRF